MLARLRKTQEENEGGFTLIELLVVVIIIGILAAIAIPTFLNQREKAWAKASQSDLRNAATQMEEFFSDNGTYLPTSTAPATTPATIVAAFKESESVTVTGFANQAGYCLRAAHGKLADVYVLRSTVGRPQKVTATAPAVADCTTADGTALP